MFRSRSTPAPTTPRDTPFQVKPATDPVTATATHPWTDGLVEATPQAIETDLRQLDGASVDACFEHLDELLADVD